MFLLVIFGTLALFLTISVPIGISIGLAAAIGMFTMTNISLSLIAQNAFVGLDSFPLLAIPFFILAGNLMTYGGISRRLLDLADTLVGHFTGGLGSVTTLACMFFAAISGSGPATVSAIGSFMIPAMKEKNYPGGYASALTASAGTIGVVIPPSIPFVIYSVVTGVSVGSLFLAGVIPGIIIGVGLMIANWYVAKKNGYTGNPEKASLRKKMATLKDAFWALMVPVIILGGIYSGIFTPTEAAVAGIFYALFVGSVIYKELGMKEIYAALRDTVLINGATNYMLGFSVSFAFLITMKQVPNQIGNYFLEFSQSPFVLLLMVNALFLVIGCFIDNISSTVILAPIFLPILARIGIDPLHFGVFLTVNLAIGFVTPPYGINLFIASTLAREPLENIVKYLMPLLLSLLVSLGLITYIPQLSLWLPGILK